MTEPHIIRLASSLLLAEDDLESHASTTRKCRDRHTCATKPDSKNILEPFGSRFCTFPEYMGNIKNTADWHKKDRRAQKAKMEVFGSSS